MNREMNEIIKEYQYNGLTGNQITCIDDIINIHEVSVLQVQGYKYLNETDQNLYKEFIINFFNAWGLQPRDTIKPLAINFVEDKEYLVKEEEDCYKCVLREVFAIYKDGRHRLLHSDELEKDNDKPICYVERHKYLRVEFELQGTKEWRHVMSPTEWY